MMTELPLTWLALRGTGLAAWTLLSATVLWGVLLRSRHIVAGSPLRMFDLHKYFGALGMTFLLAHLIFTLLDPTINFTIADVLVPGAAPWRPVAIALGIVALYLMLPVSVIGRVRSRLGKHANVWFKRSHYAAYAAWPAATGHYLMAGTDALASWAVMLTAVTTVTIAAAVALRGWRPRGQLLGVGR